MHNFIISDIEISSKEIYESILDKYCEEKWDILSSYPGHFSQELVSAFSENTEELLQSLSFKKSLIKKVFSVLIEGLQNIRFHGEKDNEDKHFGIFILAKKDGNIRMFFGSLIFEEKIKNLENRLNYLNSLNEEQVKEFYMKVLNNGIISEHGNAGLGFITMRLKSSNHLNIKFHHLLNNIFLFSIELNFNND